jgi:hypothetical protein
MFSEPLCVICSRMMHLTFTCVVCILDKLRMETVACYLISRSSIFRLWFRQCNTVHYAKKPHRNCDWRKNRDVHRMRLWLGHIRDPCCFGTVSHYIHRTPSPVKLIQVAWHWERVLDYNLIWDARQGVLISDLMRIWGHCGTNRRCTLCDMHLLFDAPSPYLIFGCILKLVRIW